MTALKKFTAILGFLAFTYAMAWGEAYNQSSEYFDFATTQQEQGNLVYALKGMNKLELRIEDTYFGGYQQVIETWESTMMGPRPDIYYAALEEAQKILPQLSGRDLQEFIEIYVQLDTRYVPEAAVELLQKAKLAGNAPLVEETTEFLREAFPEYPYQS